MLIKQKDEAPVTVVIRKGQVLQVQEIEHQVESFYEVLRIKKGCPIFLKDHIDRLNMSLKISNLAFSVDESQILEGIKVLFKACGAKDQNIKICVQNYMKGPELEILIFYIPSTYPADNLYLEGVSSKCIFFNRHNPMVKRGSTALNEVREKIDKEKVFDFICYNEDHIITEGTKTNVFFYLDGTLITAPTSKVLAGVTRSKIIALAQELEIPIVERCLHLDEIGRIDAAFFTGTSIGLLPIGRIDDRRFDFQHIDALSKLIEGYNSLIKSHILEKAILDF